MTKQQPQRKNQSNQTVANQINQSSSTISGITSPSFPNNSSITSSQSGNTSPNQNDNRNQRNPFLDGVDSIELAKKTNSLMKTSSRNRPLQQQTTSRNRQSSQRQQLKNSTPNSSMKAIAGSHTSEFQILPSNSSIRSDSQLNKLKQRLTNEIAENIVKEIKTVSDLLGVSDEEELYRTLLLNKIKHKDDSPQKTTKKQQQKK